jgi:uridine kinase
MLRTALLEVLTDGTSLRYRRAVFDYRTDSDVDMPIELAPPASILLFDGVFLHRSELRSHWDISLFLDAPFEVTIPRCALRDGSSPEVNAAENRRYVEGQKLYLEECEPRRHATIIIDNENLISPCIVGYSS